LRVGILVETGLRPPVVRIGSELDGGVMPEEVPWGTSAEMPSAEESLKTMVCSVGVGFPSGPSTTAVVIVVNASGEPRDESAWPSVRLVPSAGVAVPVGTTNVESTTVGRPSVPMTV
jgi:hypothetical protein